MTMPSLAPHSTSVGTAIRRSQRLSCGLFHVGIPRVEAERVPVPRAGDQARRRTWRRSPAPTSPDRASSAAGPRGGGVEDVEDVGRLAVADLDAEGIHQDEPSTALAARPPRSRRRASRRRRARSASPCRPERVEQVEGGDEVVDRVESLGRGVGPKPGCEGAK